MPINIPPPRQPWRSLSTYMSDYAKARPVPYAQPLVIYWNWHDTHGQRYNLDTRLSLLTAVTRANHKEPCQ